VYSRPVAPDEVIDRDDETEQLLRAAAGGHYVRLYAPRKYGKTSLLRRVLRDAERVDGMVPILVDLYGVLSLADVTVRVERAYARQLKGPLRSRIDDFLKSTGLGLSLGAFGIGVKLQLDPRVDPLPALHALLDLPLRLGQSGDRRALIAFDEFQDVAKVGELDALVRSHIQLQGEVASYVFSGSEPGLMRRLFEEQERPLYGQAVPVRLGRLGDPDIAAYVVDRFRGSERDVGDALAPLLETAQGHPQRAMLLAHRLWEELAPGETAGGSQWSAALERSLLEVQPELEARWQRFSVTEQKTLRAVVAGEGSPYRERVLERLSLNKSSAQEALKNLARRTEVEAVERRYVVVDPLFALWLRRLEVPAEPE
jgi:AAA+ ATPase superfamily predicted ATPase